MHEMSNLADLAVGGGLARTGFPSSSSKNKLRKSYSVSADGAISYLTPLQMGRHELYESIPFTAVFGLQRKEQNMSIAVSSYAADLDMLEADQIAVAMTKKHLSSQELEMRRSQASLLLLDELELDTVMVTTPLIFAVLVAAMSQFLVGYNTGVMNAPESVVFVGHSTAEWSFAVAAFAIGGPFGANLAANLAESRGRRGALLINTWLFLLGGLAQSLALNMYFIIGARFIIGFASGISSVLVPIYLGELAPPTLRGTLGTLTQFAMVVGILISDFFAFPFATESKWRILFSVTAVFAILQLFCAPWLLESPRWLLSKDTNSPKARYIIKKLRGLRYDHEVNTEIDHFVSAMEAQKVNGSGSGSSKGGYAELFGDKNVRLLVVSCFVLQMTQQLCGINAVFYYSTAIFDGVISNPLIGTTLVGAVNVVATYIALLLMDSCGRKTLLLWSTGGMFISCIILVLSLLGYLSNIYALVAVMIYVTFFEIGLGPIPWLIVAEMFDAKYVALAMSASCQINWVCNFLVGLLFPYMNDYLGAYSFVPFAGVLFLAFLFSAIWLPETQGTTPEELQAELVRKNSATVYHNMSFVDDVIGTPDEGDTAALGDQWRMAMDQVRAEEEEAMNTGTFSK
jgi:SP family facilitated glucose transporter-like MFS transporter 3